MIVNKKGFTLIELLAVIVILAIIALIATPIMMGIVRDTRQQTGARAVEGYADGIIKTVASYAVLHTEVTDIVICVGETATYDCHVDASVAAKNTGDSLATMPGSTIKALAVTYSGSPVICQNYTYNYLNGDLELIDCNVKGNDLDVYYFHSTHRAKKSN